MKKFISIFFIFFMAVTFTGCSHDEEVDEPVLNDTERALLGVWLHTADDMKEYFYFKPDGTAFFVQVLDSEWHQMTTYEISWVYWEVRGDNLYTQRYVNEIISITEDTLVLNRLTDVGVGNVFTFYRRSYEEFEEVMKKAEEFRDQLSNGELTM